MQIYLIEVFEITKLIIGFYNWLPRIRGRAEIIHNVYKIPNKDGEIFWYCFIIIIEYCEHIKHRQNMNIRVCTLYLNLKNIF